MDECGRALRSGSARDATIADTRIYPYSVLPLPSLDLAISTTTHMDEKNVEATSEWLQFWRLSTLTLLRSLRLEPGPRGDENKLPASRACWPAGGASTSTRSTAAYTSFAGWNRSSP